MLTVSAAHVRNNTTACVCERRKQWTQWCSGHGCIVFVVLLVCVLFLDCVNRELCRNMVAQNFFGFIFLL
jgi:hypothetical protein